MDTINSKEKRHKPGVAKGNIPWNKGKGGGWINSKGYHCVKIDGKDKRVHRLVMEKKLGRPLMPWEDVHHIDEDKLNNDPDNLMLLSHGEHTKVTNKRPYKKGYKLNISNDERRRRAEQMKIVRLQNAHL